ncbi:MAG TPA: hypothetical protein DCR90_05590 [Fusobacteriaceae bacterium]|nr:hypothetical protein [Fusobacteriaceae bacterium]
MFKIIIYLILFINSYGINNIDINKLDTHSKDGTLFMSLDSLNKIGIDLKLGYEENPIYIYEGKSLKAESTEESKFIDLSFTTKLFRQFDLSTGIKYVDTENEFDVGSDKYKDLLSENYDYQEMYLKLILDRKDSSIYPTDGSYLKAKHEVGGVGSEEVEYYSELGIIQGYIPITPKLSLSGSLSGGIISGGNIPLEKHFKIGGINNDIDNNYISFYGYNMMGKLASKFMVVQLGAQYMIYSNLYITAKFNTLTYGSVEDSDLIGNNDDEIYEDYEYGYGLTLGYKSIFGPLELSLTNDVNSTESAIISVNMGYVF